MNGDTDRAFEWLQKSVDEEEKGGFRPADPLLQPRADARWLSFLERIGKSPAQLGAIQFEVTLPGQ